MQNKVYLLPYFRGPDAGDGGIRRVVDAQRKYMANSIVDSEEEADVVALHAGLWVDTKKPVVLHCHGLYWNEYEWDQWHHKLNREVADNIRRADAITVPSKWVADAVQHAFWRPVEIVPHGIDVDEWPLDNAVNEGYVLWNKNRVDNVCTINELHTLARREVNTQFVTTYSGTPIPNVKVLGRQPYELAKNTVANAGVYLATTKETFGIGALEAMACNVPVLGWNWGGVAELVRHKIDGYLARPGDYDDLIEGLHWCLETKRTDGREHVINKYSWQYSVGLYKCIYNDVQQLNNKVTVIMPCYNLGRFITEAVISVIDEADEVIIVNDASTDDSWTYIDDLRKQYDKVAVINNDTNMHVAESRNIAIAAATGDYILPLDPDDKMAPGSITKLKYALDSDRNIDIAYGSVQFVTETGEPNTRIGPNGVSSWPPEFKYQGMHVYPMSYCPISSLFRRRLWENVCGYRSRYKGVEDADFWHRCLSIGAVPKKVTDDVTLIYRVRADSLSHTENRIDWTTWYPNYVPIPPQGQIRIPMCDPVLFSIIIPVGPGHSKYIQDALDSVWAQTNTKWECLVVNDTNAALDLPVWTQQLRTPSAGSGPAVARNMGIQDAQGKLVLFLDADDYLQPSALQYMLEAYLAFGPNSYVYSDIVGKPLTDNICENVLKQAPHAVTVLVPRDKCPLFNYIDAWEDWDFMLELNNSGLCSVRCAAPLLHYRLHTGSRRESMYADRENLKQVIFNKWEKYITGELTMACGSCGGQRVYQPKVNPTMAASQLAAARPQAQLNSDVVLIEYVAKSSGTRTFIGKATNTHYRFGTDQGHRIKYVHKSDATELLKFKDFKLYTQEEKQLVAAN